MHKIVLAAASVIAPALYTAHTIPQNSLVPPGQTVGWGPNTGSPVWSQTGIGPSPYQGQPYGAGTPEAPNYPFIQAPSTDYATYSSTAYIKNLNLQAFEQQANIVNQQLYTIWQSQGGKGNPPQYVGVDQAAFEKWWAGLQATYDPSSPTYGQNAPPQTFWTGVDPNNQMTNWLGTGGGVGGATGTGNTTITRVQLPEVVMPTATIQATASTGTESIRQAMQEAAAILAQDSKSTKDPQFRAEAQKLLAELAAAQQ